MITTEPTLSTILQDIADAYESGTPDEQRISYLLSCILLAQSIGKLDALETHVSDLADPWLEMPCGEGGE